MALSRQWTAWRRVARNRRAARRCARSAGSATLWAQPVPRLAGDVRRGAALLGEGPALSGQTLNDPIWEGCPPAAVSGAHGFFWLDDLAALGNGPARARARTWTAAWIARFAKGRGPGWQPEIAGARLGRWLGHSGFLAPDRDPALAAAFGPALAAHADFLALRWPDAPAGLPQVEALAALAHAALTVEGRAPLLDPALAALADCCEAVIDAQGGVASRSGPELHALVAALVHLAQALRAQDKPLPAAMSRAIARAVPVLRALRHADGALARFHAPDHDMGQPALPLDAVIAASGLRPGARAGAAMGHVRLSAGRSTVIVDTAPPAPGPGAHAATLGFELVSGRRPLIVNCGDGRAFGPAWARASRAAPLHSTAWIAGVSPSRPARAGPPAGPFAHGPERVTMLRDGPARGGGLLLSHDGYAHSHGLVHVRRLDLSEDGRMLGGEDALCATTPAQRRRFARMRARMGAALPWEVRLHLHPDVALVQQQGSGVLRLRLGSGETWLFGAQGAAQVRVAASVWLDPARAAPVPARQIVMQAWLDAPEGRIGWTLAKSQDTPVAIRDTTPAAEFTLAPGG